MRDFRMRFWMLATTLLILFCGPLSGCTPKPGSNPNSPSLQPSSLPTAASSAGHFEDVAARTGVRFLQTTGGTGKFYFIESTPGGCAFFDYDNDGYLDILLIQSGPSDPPDEVSHSTAIENRKPKIENSGRPHCALYHNNGDG